MSTTPDIFLSYNRDDQAAARLFAEGFERAGFSVWWDVTLKSGEDYDQATEQALRSAKAVVVLWSPKSVASRWVRTEATIALQSKTLVPVMIAPCQRPIMFELSQTAELGHWKGDGNDKAWLSFVSDVQQFVGRRKQTSESQTLTPGSAAATQAVVAKSNRNFLAPVAAAAVVLAAVLFIVLRDINTTPVSEAASTAAVAATTVSTPATNASTPAGVTTEKTVAVLPFANLSDDAEQEYFSDGLTEELINKLSQVDGLQVTGRNSAFFYKGQDAALKDIGTALGVAHVVQGSVRKAGNTVRITAQVVDVNTNANVWAESYDRDLSDIFAVQDEIATAITKALSITISAGEFSQLGMTTSIEAYDEFLLARTQLHAFNAESVVEAIDHYERAVNLDPGFSQAWYAMSEAYRLSPTVLPPADTANFSARRDEAIARVRALTPELPALRLIDVGLLPLESQRAEAERIYLELLAEPGKDTAVLALGYAQLLMDAGRSQTALLYAQQARRLDPKDPLISLRLSEIYQMLERPDDALAETNRGLELEGVEEFLSGQRFYIALQHSDPQAVLQALEAMPFPRPGQIEVARLWAAGDIDGALALVKANLTDASLSPVRRVTFASLATGLGYPQLAFDYALERGANLTMIWTPYFSEARKLPAFKEYVRARGLPDYWRSTGNWADKCRPLPGNNDTANDFECF